MEPIIHIHAEFRVTLILSTVLSVGLDAMFTIRGIVVLICFALAGNTLAGAPGEIRAAESAPPTTVRAHLDISAAESCATSTSVAARVAKRSSRIEFAGGARGSARVARKDRPNGWGWCWGQG